MPAFTVLEPTGRRVDAGDHADRIIFLREKFRLAAFLFGPLWMIWRCLWIVLIIYLGTVGLAGYGLQAMGIGWAAIICIFGLIQLFVGLEATSLLRWTYLRRGWRDCGIVIADDLEMAERRFFDSRAVLRPATDSVPMSRPGQPSAVPTGPLRSDIVGLFPEPGGGR